MNGDVRIKPVHPGGPALVFDLIGDDILTGGTGGWDSLSRPRREAATEWVGTPATTYVLPLLIDGIETQVGRDTVIESACRQVEKWGMPAKKTGQPPILRVTGLVQVSTSSRWVVNDIEWGTAIRNQDGRRIQQPITLTLLKYVEPKIVRGPAHAARNRRKK